MRWSARARWQKPGGSRFSASGHRAASSFATVVARTRIPRPSSTVVPTERPTSGAAAWYLARRAEQRLLQLAVDTVERAVLPVEAAAGLGGTDERRQENGAVEGAGLGGVLAGVAAGEDRGGGLAVQLVEREPGVLELREDVGARLDVVAQERPVLVPAVVLLDHEGDLTVRLDLRAERREAARQNERSASYS